LTYYHENHSFSNFWSIVIGFCVSVAVIPKKSESDHQILWRTAQTVRMSGVDANDSKEGGILTPQVKTGFAVVRNDFLCLHFVP
jgi:hypothetical protein